MISLSKLDSVVVSLLYLNLRMLKSSYLLIFLSKPFFRVYLIYVHILWCILFVTMVLKSLYTELLKPASNKQELTNWENILITKYKDYIINFEIPPADHLSKKLILNPVESSRSAPIRSSNQSHGLTMRTHSLKALSSSTADEGHSAGWKLRYSSLFCIFSLLRCLRAVAR